MGRKLWDEVKVCPRTKVWSKGRPAVIFESLHHDHDHDRSEKLQSQNHYIDSENSFQDILDLDHGILYLGPGLECGLEYAVQNLELKVDENDPLLCHRCRVEFQVELD